LYWKSVEEGSETVANQRLFDEVYLEAERGIAFAGFQFPSGGSDPTRRMFCVLGVNVRSRRRDGTYLAVDGRCDLVESDYLLLLHILHRYHPSRYRTTRSFQSIPNEEGQLQPSPLRRSRGSPRPPVETATSRQYRSRVDRGRGTCSLRKDC
jgi:hypothetical protein